MPVDPRPPVGGYPVSAPVLPPPVAPAPTAAGAPLASDFASVMEQLKADLAAGATMPGAPPPPVLPLDALNGPSDAPLASPDIGPLMAAPAAADTDAIPATAPVLATPADTEAADQATEDIVAADWRGMDARDRNRAAVEGRLVRTTANGDDWLFGEDGFGFDDLVDIVNPLQHIPIISSIYRWITGDEISPAAEMAGGALFGGPLGFAGAVANVAFEEVTGHDVAGAVIASMFGEGGADTGTATDLAALPSGGFTRGHEGVRPRGGTLAPAGPAGPTLDEDQLAEAVAPDLRDIDPGAGADDAGGGAIAPADIPAGFAIAAEEPAGLVALPIEAPAPAGNADSGIAAQMMLALDKYQALARERGLGGAPSPVPVAGTLYDGRL